MEELLDYRSLLFWLKLFLEYKLEQVFQVFSAFPRRDRFTLLYIFSMIDQAV